MSKRRKKKTYTWAEAEALAEELNGRLTAEDFRPGVWVYLRTDEGYTVWVPSAFFLKIGDWFGIFAEHHKPQLHHADEVEDVDMFIRHTAANGGPASIMDIEDYRPQREEAPEK